MMRRAGVRRLIDGAGRASPECGEGLAGAKDQQADTPIPSLTRGCRNAAEGKPNEDLHEESGWRDHGMGNSVWMRRNRPTWQAGHGKARGVAAGGSEAGAANSCTAGSN